MSGRSAAALLVLCAGCATSTGSLGVVGPDADAVGVKLLRPGARARVCRDSLFGVPLGSREPALQAALAQLLALDHEGDVLTNVEITTRTLTTGVYDRRCVELRGDLGRMVPTLTIPVPGHDGH
jgi:hypothetical protein